MGAGSHAMASGIVLGLVVVFLGQQFGYLDLSATFAGLETLVLGAVAGGIIGGLIGRWLGRRAERSLGPKAWKGPEPETKAPADGSKA